MLKRLLLGLLIGLVVGGVVAAGVVKGLPAGTFDVAAFAYLLAAATGALTGLFAGKPIWSSDGKIEAGLKAFFGALLAAGALFALRQWVKVPVDLTALGAGAGAIGELPAAALPAVAATLGAIFELDNTGNDDSNAKKASNPNTRVASSKANVRVGGGASDDDELDDVPVAAAKKKR